ncbi:GNAT family N-acetyltransferase [Brevundimonas sp.]|uniref:GNAT family N-acetyltransferase n=1 Tax=Brevundimonas sp. TaxID=1871086 RepID=UPI003BAADE81
MPATAAISTMPQILAEQADDAGAIDALVLAAFGPGRFAKTAERLRESARQVRGFTACDGERLIGSVRLWSVTVGTTPAWFLGPIAVDEASRMSGLGAALVAACVEAARADGVPGVILIGDPPYFARFGFEPAPQARLPGPADPRRVMWLAVDAPVPSGDILPN